MPTITGLKANIERQQKLRAQLEDLTAQRKRIVDTMNAEHRDELTVSETRSFNVLTTQIDEILGCIADLQDDIERSGVTNPTVQRIMHGTVTGASSGPAAWAETVRKAVVGMGGETRAVVSGSVDVPSLVEPSVAAIARPQRILDLLTVRQQIDSNAYEYFRQTVRTTAAAPVADNAQKPTSTLTVVSVPDRCRVHAHLSEPAPIRLWQDAPAVTSWLQNEMIEGVYDSIETDLVTGDGAGEHQTGLLHTAGTTAVTAAATPLATLRKALTTAQTAGITPTGWVLSPADAETVDLARWGTDGGFLADGFENGHGRDGSSNVFGPQSIPRVVSPSVPAGTALLADWSALKLYVRETTRVDIDAGGVLFGKNQFVARGEARVGIALLRPAAILVVDLTP